MVLFCWELGAGLGHLMQMLPLARCLVRSGHRVAVALRHLSQSAADVFGRCGVSFLQAPFRSSGTLPYARPASFAHLLGNVGFHRDGELFVLAGAWRNLLRLVKPDLLVADHAPTALLASRGLPLRRAVIGSGFCYPPDECPFPVIRPEAEAAGVDLHRLAEDERRVLDRANRLLAVWGQEPMDRLSRLYADVDGDFLTTFPELDHYPCRRGGRYWGPVLAAPDEAGDGNGSRNGNSRSAVRWPDAPGRRVFAYLKQSRALDRVLRMLHERRCPTVAYVEGVPPAELRERFKSPSLGFEDRPLDLRRVAAECDLAVLNGGHGATAEMLLAGKPVLQVPLVLEQLMTARAVEQFGAGASAPFRRCEPWQGDVALDALLTEDRFALAARRFAHRYAAFDPRRQREAMLARAEELLCETPALV